MNQKINKNLKISTASKNSELSSGASLIAPLIRFYQRISIGNFLSSNFFLDQSMSEEQKNTDHDHEHVDPDGSSPMEESNDQETSPPLAGDGVSPGSTAFPAAANTVPTNTVVLPKFAPPNYAEMFKAAGTATASTLSVHGLSAPGADLARDTPSFGYSPSIEDYVNVYENYILTTHVLLVCFIPLRINHQEFCALMDTIQHVLKIGNPTRYYAAADFGQRFDAATTNPWMDDGFAFPEEEQGHATYILTLSENIPFGYMGHLSTVLRPLAFQVTIEAPFTRRILVQPAPSNFSTALRRAPIAVWRGVGTDLTHGNVLSALALVTLQVNASAAHLQQNDPPQQRLGLVLLHLPPRRRCQRRGAGAQEAAHQDCQA